MNFATNSTSPPDVTYKTAENLNVGAQASIRRISRHPDSMIRFAEYDPATATGDPTGAYAFRNLSLNEELCRPKRVVIEFMPNGSCTWRYVPNALWEDNVENEGTWPRVVDVCGYVFCLLCFCLTIGFLLSRCYRFGESNRRMDSYHFISSLNGFYTSDIEI